MAGTLRPRSLVGHTRKGGAGRAGRTDARLGASEAYGAGVSPSTRRTTVAIVNDYEVVVRGVLGLLEPFADRVSVLELDVDLPVSIDVDIALYDAFSMTGTQTKDLDEVVGNACIGALVIYSWNLHEAIVKDALARGARSALQEPLGG